MRLSFLFVSLIALALLGPTVSAAGYPAEKVDLHAADQLQESVVQGNALKKHYRDQWPTTKSERVNYHDEALRLSKGRTPLNKGLRQAGIDGASKAKADMAVEWSDGHYGRAVHEGLHIMTRPLKGTLYSMGSSIRDATTEMKHSKLAQVFVPGLSKKGQLHEKQNRLKEKHSEKVQWRQAKIDKLSHGEQSRSAPTQEKGHGAPVSPASANGATASSLPKSAESLHGPTSSSQKHVADPPM